MANKGTGRWAALLAASFVAHTAFIVNSTETALWNEQGRMGLVLGQQLADTAAPLALSRDMISLSVLAGRYEGRPGIDSVRLYNARHELIAESGDTRDSGRLFTTPMNLQQQALGQVEMRLSVPPRGQLVRENLGNIGLSALLHALVFLSGFFLSARTPAPRPLQQATPLGNSPAAPAPVVPAHHQGTEITLLHIALDDPNGLLTRVSASMADELLNVFDQFIDRAARLYGGEVTGPFSPEGVLVRFAQPDALEREFQALAAAALFLQLVQDSAEERRQHGRLCLGAKAGVLHGRDDAHVAAVLAHTAPAAGRILGTLPGSMLGTRCRLSAPFQLAVSNTQSLQAALVEEFAPEYRQLISNQSQQILGPLEIS
ncbi:MAG: hypothetical protein K0R03_1035 [Moraxellaceae bacterium]|jgi:hypothetical protein|nr:hypothetical protein [Moraxellaceae bacterium]